MQFRHELKHEISNLDVLILRQRLKAIMQPDTHAVNGQYQIRSLYFDNLEDKALREKLDGVSIREKYRIRLYNHDPNTIRLERKFKHNSLGTTLIALTMIASMVILAVTSNVILSLGMVGALSIVRFRTPIKEPLDIAFLFCSIGAGIVLAAGLIPLAMIGSLCIGIMLLIFANRKSNTHPYIVVLNCENHEAEVKAKELLEQKVTRSVVKSKSAFKGSIELNIEVRLKEDDTDFINLLAEMPGVNSAVIVSYNGDYMG